MSLTVGLLASGEGTTLQSIVDACADGRIRGQVAVVISNNSGSGALRRARAAGMPAHHLSSVTHPEPEALDAAIEAVLVDARVDVVLLAGYLKRLGPGTLSAFRGRVLNTHPALLPKFGGTGMFGDRVFQAVLASGDSESGVSLHLVDENYDTGAVVRQARLPIAPGELHRFPEDPDPGTRTRARRSSPRGDRAGRTSLDALSLSGNTAPAHAFEQPWIEAGFDYLPTTRQGTCLFVRSLDAGRLIRPRRFYPLALARATTAPRRRSRPRVSATVALGCGPAYTYSSSACASQPARRATANNASRVVHRRLVVVRRLLVGLPVEQAEPPVVRVCGERPLSGVDPPVRDDRPLVHLA